MPPLPSDVMQYGALGILAAVLAGLFALARAGLQFVTLWTTQLLDVLRGHRESSERMAVAVASIELSCQEILKELEDSRDYRRRIPEQGVQDRRYQPDSDAVGPDDVTPVDVPLHRWPESLTAPRRQSPPMPPPPPQRKKLASRGDE